VKSQEWFEMPEVRRRRLSDSVWVPLFGSLHLSEAGGYGQAGYLSEFVRYDTLAVPGELEELVDELTWNDLAYRGFGHSGYVDDGEYIPTDIYKGHPEGLIGVRLALELHFNAADGSEWQPNQDMVFSLGLKREGNVWVRPSEGYLEVIRLHQSAEGGSSLLEIRSSQLRDYLCARDMSLYVATYRERMEFVSEAPEVAWPTNPNIVEDGRDRWEGRTEAVAEGGDLAGSGWAVFRAAWKEEFGEGDVPVLGEPDDDSIDTDMWEGTTGGPELARISGELWRVEPIGPAAASPIVRGDEEEPIASFFIDAEGRRADKRSMPDEGRWLWFNPALIPALAHRRGGNLSWYTHDTGSVRCSPDHGVHFGVNGLGLVTVFADDVLEQPSWQQQIWAGYNVRPEGGVSEELRSAQVQVKPAETQAPEAYLEPGMQRLSQVVRNRFGVEAVRDHADVAGLMSRCHRFRAVDEEGLLALAKDLTRVVADRIDATALQTIVAPEKGKKWGSLKSLEKVVAADIGYDKARALFGPLFGIYELRIADAHLSNDEREENLRLARVDPNSPLVIQGCQMIESCVQVLWSAAAIIDSTNSSQRPQPLG